MYLPVGKASRWQQWPPLRNEHGSCISRATRQGQPQRIVRERVTGRNGSVNLNA